MSAVKSPPRYKLGIQAPCTVAGVKIYKATLEVTVHSYWRDAMNQSKCEDTEGVPTLHGIVPCGSQPTVIEVLGKTGLWVGRGFQAYTAMANKSLCDKHRDALNQYCLGEDVTHADWQAVFLFENLILQVL